jgi:hypothetical protein
MATDYPIRRRRPCVNPIRKSEMAEFESYWPHSSTGHILLLATFFYWPHSSTGHILLLARFQVIDRLLRVSSEIPSLEVLDELQDWRSTQQQIDRRT